MIPLGRIAERGRPHHRILSADACFGGRRPGGSSHVIIRVLT
jgi:hypothetical protein